MVRGKGFNPFSFRSPSKRDYLLTIQPGAGFNPFSFRSPSKRAPSENDGAFTFQSLLLQVSFKTS